MARPLREIVALRKKYDNVPVWCNGDIFDRWDASPETINFALRELPVMSAVPGQHDLPNHRYDAIQKSAYWTLVEAGKVKNLIPGSPYAASDEVTLHGFPWGEEIKPLACRGLGVAIEVAVIHKYAWHKAAKYPDAPEDANILKWKGQLKGYDTVCIGDNHEGFLLSGKNQTVLNCGALMRRRSNEQLLRPSVGLVHSDGTVVRHFLDVSQDVLASKAEALESALQYHAGVEDFIDALVSLGDCSIDFLAAVDRLFALKNVSRGVRELVLAAVEKKP